MNLKELIVENGEGDKLSMGRIMAWIIFVVMVGWFWLYQSVDIPDNMLYVFITLAGYNLSKKVRDVAADYVATMENIKGE